MYFPQIMSDADQLPFSSWILGQPQGTNRKVGRWRHRAI